jgi:hypothetical protein
MNRLYVELLNDSPSWGKAERRHDMNHFMARLIFCFFAEDTGIFNSMEPLQRGCHTVLGWTRSLGALSLWEMSTTVGGKPMPPHK